jgi:hypothetical protein
VCEIGVDYAVSTVALILGAREKVYSFDIVTRSDVLKEIKDMAGDKWEFTEGDSRKITIPQCGMLFIDSYHDRDTLLAELRRHNNDVSNVIVMHDTETFGIAGQDGKPGMREALDIFLKENRHWVISRHDPMCHGLTTLERNV